MNNEPNRMWKETVMSQCETIFRHLKWGTARNHKKNPQWESVKKASFQVETKTHGLGSRSFLQSTAKFGEVQRALSFLLRAKRQAPATKLSFTRLNWIVYEEIGLWHLMETCSIRLKHWVLKKGFCFPCEGPAWNSDKTYILMSSICFCSNLPS
jgi:hypothetical protein